MAVLISANPSYILLYSRSSSVLLQHEIALDGTIVSAAFDDSLEMGIVGSTAGTLWYINWTENASIRLISGHKNKVRGAGLGWFVLQSRAASAVRAVCAPGHVCGLQKRSLLWPWESSGSCRDH